MYVCGYIRVCMPLREVCVCVCVCVYEVCWERVVVLSTPVLAGPLSHSRMIIPLLCRLYHNHIDLRIIGH
jgi:hypothetical protein